LCDVTFVVIVVIVMVTIIVDGIIGVFIDVVLVAECCLFLLVVISAGAI